MAYTEAVQANGHSSKLRAVASPCLWSVLYKQTLAFVVYWNCTHTHTHISVQRHTSYDIVYITNFVIWLYIFPVMSLWAVWDCVQYLLYTTGVYCSWGPCDACLRLCTRPIVHDWCVLFLGTLWCLYEIVYNSGSQPFFHWDPLCNIWMLTRPTPLKCKRSMW
jgi:hypothetical protein